MTLIETTEALIRDLNVAVANSRAARGATAEEKADARLAEAERAGMEDSWYEEEL